ncbi:MAG TPA: O-antigen ligase family protein [Vicinamibacterales bacterium]
MSGVRIGARRRQPPLRAWTRGLIALTVVAWAAAPFAGVELSLWILTLAGFAAVAAGYTKPAVGALGIAVLCTLDPVTRLFLMSGGLLRWNTLNYLLILLAFVYVRHLLRTGGASLSLLAALTALFGLEIAISAHPETGLENVIPVAAAFGLIACLSRARGEPQVWHAMALVTGTIGALGGFAFFALHETLINRNAWGWFPLTALLAIALASAASPRGSGFILVLLAFVNLTWTFLSASRGDLVVGLVVTVAIVLAGRAAGRRLVAATVAAAAAIAIGSHFIDLSDRAMARLGMLTADDTLRQRTSGRSDLMRGGWYIFLDHPLGVGTGGFPAAWATLTDRPELTFHRGKAFNAHSGWVKTLAENGVPGFALLLAFVFSFSVRALRGFGPGRWLGFVTTLVIATALLTTEFQGKGIWFLAAGTMALGGVRRIRRVAVTRSRLPARQPWRVAHG